MGWTVMTTTTIYFKFSGLSINKFVIRAQRSRFILEWYMWCYCVLMPVVAVINLLI